MQISQREQDLKKYDSDNVENVQGTDQVKLDK